MNRDELRLLGLMNLVLAACLLLATGIVLAVIVGGGALIPEPVVNQVSSWLGFGVSILLLVLSIPNLVAGAAAFQGHAWAPQLLVVTAALNLLNLPLGTVVAVYTFYVVWKRKLY
jgi:hypothetical protein